MKPTFPIALMLCACLVSADFLIGCAGTGAASTAQNQTIAVEAGSAAQSLAFASTVGVFRLSNGDDVDLAEKVAMADKVKGILSDALTYGSMTPAAINILLTTLLPQNAHWQKFAIDTTTLLANLTGPVWTASIQGLINGINQAETLYPVSTPAPKT